MKRFWKDKRGSSLVLVLITMSFLILLAGAIITMTITNLRLKISQKQSQENFYKTDSILDNISAGIQNESSKASADSYALALAEYNSALTSASNTLDQRYSKSYLEKMLQVLTGDSQVVLSDAGVYYYNDNVLMSYVSAEERSKYQVHSGTYTDTAGNSYTGDELLVDGNSLIMKNVSVLQEDNSYETKLTTDIRIEVPSVDTEAHSEYLDYAILADDQIYLDMGTSIAKVNGNLYSGTVNRTASDKKSQQGIILNGGGKVTINAQYIISRGDVSVGNNSTLNVSGNLSGDAQLWVENILTGDSANTIHIQGDCNVADDMELNGTGDVVTLSGRYYGYNYNDDYTDKNKLATKASYSSAISINGKNETLKLDSLNTLILSGRTFISKNPNTGEILTDASGTDINPDIELGESLTVKSSQLAYYVPGEFVTRASVLGVSDYDSIVDFQGEVRSVTDADGVTKDWYFFRLKDTVTDAVYAFDFKGYNEYLDIKDTDYQNIMSQNSYDLFKDETNTDKTSFDIMDFLDTQALQIYHRRDANIQDIDYFYLKFASPKLTSMFYQIFHQCSPQQSVYSEVDKAYLSTTGVTICNGDAILLTSGNILYGNSTDANLSMKIQNTEPKAESPLAKYADNKAKEYMSRQLALIPDYSDALSSPKWRLSENNSDSFSKCGKSDKTNLFDKLVDRDKLKDTSGTMTTSYGNGTYIVSKSDVEWDSASSYGNSGGLIITSGTVTLKQPFSGLIIAGEDVKLGFSLNDTDDAISSDEKLVGEMLKQDKAGAMDFYDLLSKYFRKSVDATIGESSSNSSNNINYENWKKNDGN